MNSYKFILLTLLSFYQLIDCSPAVKNNFNSNRNSIIPSDDYDRDSFVLSWELGSNNDIIFHVKCKTKGWIAIGVSPDGYVANSDFMIGWVTQNGQAFLRDTNTMNGASKPVIDEVQDWELIDGYEEGEYTYIDFKRNAYPCDKKEDVDLKQETNYLLFGFSNNDPATGENDWEGFDPNNVKTRAITILDPSYETVSNEEISKAETFEYAQLNYHVSSDDTDYICEYFEFPEYEQETVTIISYDVLVDPNTLPFLHHVLVFECERAWLGGQELYRHKCGNYDYTPDMNKCINSRKIVTWAKGANQKFRFPTGSGITVSRKNSDKVYLAEFHYDNQLKLDNIIDNSSVKFFISKSQPKNELGILQLTSSTSPTDVLVPPKMESLTFSTTCESHCTNAFVPEDGINILIGFHHTHLAGRKVRTLVTDKNGIIKRNLFDNEKYDSNHQFERPIQSFKLNKGDKLFLQCEFSSINRNHTTFWGFESYNEMCINYIYYYPKVKNFDMCVTFHTSETISSFFLKLKRDNLISAEFEVEPFRRPNVTAVKSYFGSLVNYSDELKERFIEFNENPGNQHAFCGTGLEGEIRTNPFFKPKNALVKEEPTCKAGISKNTGSKTPINSGYILTVLIISLGLSRY